MRRGLVFVLGLFWVLVPVVSWTQDGSSSLERAYDHLYETLEGSAFFVVYDDKGSRLNHFVPSGWMGDDPKAIKGVVKLNEGSIFRPLSGKTCIRVTFKPKSPENWAAVYWQTPPGNWGKEPGAGFDLTGATKLTFWGRGNKGDEKVEFFALGMGRDPETGEPLPDHPYPDSSPKVSLGYVSLSREWKQYLIDLQGKDLSHVIGGYGWALNATQNPKGATFFLDDIRFEGDLRLPASYKALGPTDRAIENAAFVYDTTLMVLVLMARGNEEDLQKAKALLDSLIYVQGHDRFYTDGRLRNAYRAGELVDHQTGQALLPGWWNGRKWVEEQSQVGSHTGNLAWAMVALLRYYQLQGGQPYLDAVRRLGEWIFQHTYDGRGAGGYTAGFDGGESEPAKFLTKSVEHNLAVYVAFMGLYETAKEGEREAWRQRAMHAKGFVRAMWNSEAGFFWVGTEEDGVKTNEKVLTLDSNTLSLLALGERARYGKGLSSWAEGKFRLQDKKCLKGAKGVVSGFDFNNDRDGIWWEGTAQASLAYQFLGEESKAEGLLGDLERVQSSAPNGNGKGIVAACRNKVTTGFNWRLTNRLHVGATAWYILAKQGINPYWWTGPEDPIPYEGQYE